MILQNHLAHGLLLVLVHCIRNELNPLLVLGKCRLAALGQLIDRGIPALLVIVENSDFHLFLRNDLANRTEELLRNRRRFVAVLLFADFCANFCKEFDELLIYLVRLENRINHDLFRNFLRARFNHDYFFCRARDRKLKIGNFLFRVGRIDDKLAVNQTDLRHRTGTVKRNIRDGDRECGAEHGRELGRAIRIYAHHKILERHIVPVILRKQRTHRAVNDAVCQNRIFGGLALTLHEAAGNLADGILTLIVFDGKRKEVDALSRLFRSGCRGEHNGIAVVHQHSAVRLCAHSSDFCRQGSAGKFHAIALKLFAHVFSSSSPVLLPIPTLFVLTQQQGGINSTLSKKVSCLLLSESELLNQSAVTIQIRLLQIAEQASSLTNHHEKTSSRMVILRIRLQVLGELRDALGQNCNLNLRRTRVAFFSAVCLDELCLLLFRNHSVLLLSWSDPKLRLRRSTPKS